MFLYGFDLLAVDDMDLRRERLDDRRAKLRQLLAQPDGIQFSDHHAGDGEIVFRRECMLGLEGIVSKRCDATYRSGRRRGSGPVHDSISEVYSVRRFGLTLGLGRSWLRGVAPHMRASSQPIVRPRSRGSLPRLPSYDGGYGARGMALLNVCLESTPARHIAVAAIIRRCGWSGCHCHFYNR